MTSAVQSRGTTERDAHRWATDFIVPAGSHRPPEGHPGPSGLVVEVAAATESGPTQQTRYGYVSRPGAAGMLAAVDGLIGLNRRNTLRGSTSKMTPSALPNPGLEEHWAGGRSELRRGPGYRNRGPYLSGFFGPPVTLEQPLRGLTARCS
jgi:hypothetical protein